MICRTFTLRDPPLRIFVRQMFSLGSRRIYMIRAHAARIAHRAYIVRRAFIPHYTTPARNVIVVYYRENDFGPKFRVGLRVHDG